MKSHKRITIAIILMLAITLIFTSCQKPPVDEPVDSTPTTTEASTDVTTQATSQTERDSMTEASRTEKGSETVTDVAGSSSSNETSNTAHTTLPVTSSSKPSTAAQSSRTATSSAATTNTTKAQQTAKAVTTTRKNASSTTKPPSATVSTTKKVQQQTFNITQSELSGLTSYTYTMTTIDSSNTEKTRSFTGVRLKDFLQKKGVDLQALGSGATLAASDGVKITYSRNLILDDNTLIAWNENNSPIGYLRICPGSVTDANMYLKKLASITLNP